MIVANQEFEYADKYGVQMEGINQANRIHAISKYATSISPDWNCTLQSFIIWCCYFFDQISAVFMHDSTHMLIAGLL